MPPGRIPAGRIVGLAVLALTTAGIFNVLGDNQAVETRARAEACAGRGRQCVATMARLLRTPFFQDLQFRVPGAVVEVRCQRSLYLVGSYACHARTPDR
jgi:hypothetical protein